MYSFLGFRHSLMTIDLARLREGEMMGMMYVLIPRILP